MDILDIAGRTRVLGAPADWNAERDGPCGGLPVRDEPFSGSNKMISEWKPNEIELEHLKLGAPLQLGIVGTVHPVVSLGVGAVPPREREEPAAIDHPPPGEDLAGQGEPLAVWIRRAIMANLKGEADGVDEAVAVIVSNLEALAPDLVIQGEPVAWPVRTVNGIEDLPAEEALTEKGMGALADSTRYAIEREARGIVNVFAPNAPPALLQGITVALYRAEVRRIEAVRLQRSATAPSRPADREEIARALEEGVCSVCKRDCEGGVTPMDCDHSKRCTWDPPTQNDQIRRLLALRDAPRNGGDGTQEDRR